MSAADGSGPAAARGTAAAGHESAPGLWLRGVRPPLQLRDFRVIAFDMDSTLIDIECIDEVADAAGRKTEVAAITEASMRGEISDFSESLRQRVSMLAGVPASFLDEVWRDRLHFHPGARTLLAAVRAAGLRTLLVSGGFTHIAARVAAELGIDEVHANALEVIDGKLSGRVLGSIVDGAAKREHLMAACKALGVDAAQSIAVGDGANDIPMMQAAGLSCAYRGKVAVDAVANVAIRSGGIDRLLEVLRP